MLRYDRQLAWFSRLVPQTARKQSRSIHTTPEPTRGALKTEMTRNQIWHVNPSRE